MTDPRNEKMTLGVIETHHVWTRCVQQAHLCGLDARTGTDYSHRRIIIEAIIAYQAEMLAIDLGSYNILENHLHSILRARPDIVDSWSDWECAHRYKAAWPKWDGEQWLCEPSDQEIEELLANTKRMEYARIQLGSISFFMARVKQPLSWTFNREVEKRGSFWDKRFGNRRLETDEEVLGCMLYCDLNQVRAGMADRLEDSHPSAIQKRILAEDARQAWIAEHSLESWQRLQRELEDCEDPVRQIHEQGIEALFQDCLLSPITDEGPLATIEAIALAEHPRQSQDIAPVTRLWQDPLQPNIIIPAKLEDEVDEQSVESETGAKKKQSKAKSIHRRMKRKLRRRQSDLSIISIPWLEYLRKAKELEDVCAAGRSVREHCSEEDWSETPTTVRKQVHRFVHSISDTLRSLLDARGESSHINARAEPAEAPSHQLATSTPPPTQARVPTQTRGQPPPDS